MQNLDNRDLKLEALFLNRVEGLEWYYFDLDLNAADHMNIYREQAENSFFSGREASVGSSLEFITRTDTGQFKFPGNGNGNGIDPVVARTFSRIRQNGESVILRDLLAYVRSNPGVPRRILKRIFDANEPSVLNMSEADVGLLGRFNRNTHGKRRENFLKKFRKAGFGQGRRNGSGIEKNYLVMAEGDSWFLFPKVFFWTPVKDIIYWLSRQDRYAVYSLAAGGDWLSNIIKTADYIEELDRINPDAFLFSGGGNDMVGNYRLAKMIFQWKSQAQIFRPEVYHPRI